MLNKLKIEYHTFFAYYHALMMASVFNAHDPQGTMLYLKHWMKHTKHKDLAIKFRTKALIRFVENDTEY
jgi:hypothetical protein